MTEWVPAVRDGSAGGGEAPGYWKFYDEVAARQLRDWLAGPPCRVLDLSGNAGRYAELAAAAGHRVLHVSRVPDPTLRSERLQVVTADTDDFGWLRPAGCDVVLAEGCALSEHLAAELTLDRIRSVLRPGGRLLLCVESLVLGLARLAGQERWAELADVPSADVVLVPDEDGSISRCFWPEELQQMLADDGFDVEWVRPRTVLSQDAVNRALAAEPSALETLVSTELALAEERQGESIGIHLLASARRR